MWYRGLTTLAVLAVAATAVAEQRNASNSPGGGAVKNLTKVVACALMSASTSYAQSSVTVYGLLDVNYSRTEQGGVSLSRLVGTGSQYATRLGFRGQEDLGDGWAAGFWLEAGFGVDNGMGLATNTNNTPSGTVPAGGLTFNRRSTVSLMNTGLGELRVGRDGVPTYWNYAFFDPFLSAGAGSVLNMSLSNATSVPASFPLAARASNSLGYFSPDVAGFVLQLMVATGENSSSAPSNTRHDGNYRGVRLTYRSGPLQAGASYDVSTLGSGDVTHFNVGGIYDLGRVKAHAIYYHSAKDAPAVPNRSRGYMLGASVSLGVGYVPVSYSTIRNNRAPLNDKAGQMAVGYVHLLSKRTSLYATLSSLRNKNNAALSGGGVTGVAGRSWSGLDLGIKHSF